MKINSHIGIFYHELSGNGKGASIAIKTGSLLKSRGVSYELHANYWPDRIDIFTEIWVAGGDGSIHYFINMYPDSHIPIAMLGGGTGNDLKTYLYGNLPLEEHVENLLQPAFKEIDLGKCNGKLYANSLGIGFDGDVLKNMDSIRFIGGHLGYLLAVIKSIFTYKEKTFTIRFHDVEKTIRPVILAISNARLTGGGFIIAPKSSLEDGLLDLLFTDPLPWWKRLQVLPKVEKGKHLEYEFVYHYYVNSLEIITDKPVLYQIDGEMDRSSHFKIQMAEKKLLLNCRN